VRLVGYLFKKKSITMPHGNMNVKLTQYLRQQTAQSITIICLAYPHTHTFRPLQGHHQGGIHSTQAYKYKKFCQIRARVELKCNIFN
jgi:hypothetical protein